MPDFLLGDIRIEVIYKRVKQLRLTVYPPDGRVCISAPLQTSADYIRDFALSKLPWIEKHRAQYRLRPGAKNRFANHEIHYVWGVAHTLELIERAGHPKVILQDGCMRVYVRPDSTKAKRQAFLDKWYHRLLEEAAPSLIRKWEAPIGVQVKKLYLRKMKSHWGSCNYGRQTIRLNTELAKKPPLCLEYVIIHELIHLIEPSHNHRFYELMNRFMPSWKDIRKKMNTGEI
jgi:predicted metal-dependent hydrolase